MRALSLSFKNTFPARVQHTPEMIFEPMAWGRLVAWYDFSDSSTMFTDPAITTAASNGDSIRSVKNKAYDGLGASTTSLKNLF